ncbi:MAG: hypothetical protein ACLFPD_10725, partial [Desulfosudaceae bacterium]
MEAIAVNDQEIAPTSSPETNPGDVVTFRVQVANTYPETLNNVQVGVEWGMGLVYQGNLSGENLAPRYDPHGRKIRVNIAELTPTGEGTGEETYSYTFDLKVAACDELSLTVHTDELYAVLAKETYYVSVRMAIPEIRYAVSANPDQIATGETNPVEINLTNVGQGPASDLVVGSNLAAFSAAVSNVSDGFGYDPDTGMFICGQELSPGQSLTLHFDMALDSEETRTLPKRAILFSPEYAGGCGERFHASPTPVVLRPPRMDPSGSGANLGVDLLLKLPDMVEECGEYQAEVKLTKTRPDDYYDLDVSLNTGNHYTYLGDLEATGFNGLRPRVDSDADEGRVDFSFGMDSQWMEQRLTEGGSLRFKLRKTCATPADMTTTASFIHELAAERMRQQSESDETFDIRKREVTVHAEPLFNKYADLSLRVTPESCRIIPGMPMTWTIYVVNQGSATATDVVCENILGEGLQLQNAGSSDAGAATVKQDTPVHDKTTVAWNLGDIGPSRQKKVTVTALPAPDQKVSGLLMNNNTIRAASGCDDEVCHSREKRAPRFIQPQERISGSQVFEGCGRLHGFLSVTEMYKSNLYKTWDEDNEEDVWATYVTPGIWAALPGSCQRLIEVSTTTAAPGGLAVQPNFPVTDRRYQGYLLYSPQFEFYEGQSDDNMVSHRVDGYFHYNTRNKLLLRFIEQYKRTHDSLSSRNFTIDDKYHANLARATADLDLTHKLGVGMKYTNYILSYDASENDHANRVDNIWGLTGSFRLTSKVALFAEYDYANIYYSDNDLDNNEHQFYGGVRWEITGKSRGRLKGGYGRKTYDASELSDVDTWMAG